MALGLAIAVRNARLQVIANALDAGAAGGTLRIYTGTRPATGGALAGNTLLGTLTFSKPCAATVANGVLTFAAVAPDPAADADGTAKWARAADSAGTFVSDLSVGESGSGADLILNTVNIVQGGEISISAAQITDGNA